MLLYETELHTLREKKKTALTINEQATAPRRGVQNHVLHLFCVRDIKSRKPKLND